VGISPIFVYGTLLSGGPNHHLLADSRGGGPVRTDAQFELVDLGPYPALLRGGRTAVEGELYFVTDEVKRVLDELEGHPDLYQRSRITLEDGRQVEAYLLDRRRLSSLELTPSAPPRVIAHGDWRAWCKIAVLAFFIIVGLVGNGLAEGRRRDAGTDSGHAAASASASASPAPPPSATEAPPTSATHTAPPPSATVAPQEPVPESAGFPVKLRDARIFTVRIPWSGRTAEERARAASQALQKVVEANEPPNVRVDEQNDVATIYVGDRLIIQLGRDDALAAGDVSLRVHTESVASKVRDGLHVEEKRVSLLKMGITLVVVLVTGILALFLVRRVGRLVRATRTWLQEQPERVPALRVQSIYVVRPSTLRLLFSGTVRILVLVLQIGIAYGWLLFALYIFEPTREYTGRLTELVTSPLSGFTSKVGSSIPVLVIATASIAALVIMVRFVGAFFDSAARGETAIGWVPPDMVGTTSLVVRFAIVVLFLVVAIPFITGSEDAALSRIGLVAVLALGLASTPMLASMCVGLFVVYGRGLTVGDFASFGPHAGRIDSITLLDVRLRDVHGCEMRVPHLLSLFHPTRVLGKVRPVSAIISVASGIPQPALREMLAGVASNIGTEPRLEILSIDAAGTCYRVTVRSEQPEAEQRLYFALADALTEQSVPLGTAPKS
jgi:gamma-glutamylcyclotransferase (GGCT)/AIG2-like uncharacterized protein YtfP